MSKLASAIAILTMTIGLSGVASAKQGVCYNSKGSNPVRLIVKYTSFYANNTHGYHVSKAYYQKWNRSKRSYYNSGWANNYTGFYRNRGSICHSVYLSMGKFGYGG